MLKGPHRFAQVDARAARPTRWSRFTEKSAGICAFCLRESCSVAAKVLSFATIVALLLLLLLDGKDRELRLDPRVTAWIAQALGAEDVAIGSVRLALGAKDRPAEVTLEDIRIGETARMGPVSLSRVETGVSVLDGLRGQFRPENLELEGVTLVLTRTPQGTLTLDSGTGQPTTVYRRGSGLDPEQASFTALLSRLAMFEDQGLVERLTSVTFRDLSFTFVDARSGRVWETRAAEGSLRNTADGLSARLSAELQDDTGETMELTATLRHNPVTGTLRNAVRFTGARPADLATQVEVLEWMSLIDASVDGALAAEVGADGQISTISGQLSLGQGNIDIGPDQAVRFERADAYFDYDPGTDQFTLSNLDIDTDHGAFESSGTVTPDRGIGGGIDGLLGQLDLENVRLNTSRFLAAPVAFPSGQAVARVRFQPFRFDLGEATLREGASRATIKGSVWTDAADLNATLDATVSQLPVDRVLPLWPTGIVPGVRRWIDGHIEAGQITSLDLHLRRIDGRTRTGLEMAFTDGVMQVLPDLPKVTGIQGVAQYGGGRFDLTMTEGSTQVTPDQRLDLAGSRFSIDDARQRPAQAEVSLAVDGPVTGALALIDRQPLQLLSKAGRDPGLARGWATGTATLGFPLIKGLTAKDFTAHVAARVEGVTSERIVQGRRLAAEVLEVNATNDNLQVRGPIRLDGVPMQIAYAQTFGAAAGPAQVAGTLDVTPDRLADLGILLPPGSISGQGAATFNVTLAAGAPGRFETDLSLDGVGLSIPALSWQKDRSTPGTLRLEGRMTEPVTLDRIGLAAPGLALEGTIEITPDGRALRSAEFSRLALGAWLDAPLRWTPGEGGGSDIEIDGGTLDLSSGELPPPRDGRTRIRFAPDKVIVTDAIRLTDVEGRIDTGAAPMGRFKAQVNGRAPIDGVLRTGGEAFLSSPDGGGVLAATGIFRNALGGTLRISLKPGADGGPLRGVFSLKDTRVKNAPALAELLLLANILALPDRLAGPGIGFTDAQGRYAIDDGRIFIENGRAIGPSLGITLGGVYDITRGALQLEGVVSPFYAVNGLAERIPVLGRLLGGRPGEGILGANFTITGQGSDPRVAVNPLSLLTPGAARELFQSRAQTTQ